MCGITGYIGAREAVSTALNNLKRLEYRGYDSAGIAYLSSQGLEVVRAEGRIVNLEKLLSQVPAQASAAIAHTRWATHGRPCETNAHPHTDCKKRLAVVHNGIIENYVELRQQLLAQGHVFASETDTETLAHLIEANLPSTTASQKEIARAIRAALSRVRGSYAIAVICTDTPQALYVARQDSPLIIGLGHEEKLIASDITALLQHTRHMVPLEDGDFAVITPQRVIITDRQGSVQERAVLHVDWDDQAAEKGGYAHFMLKEIHEGPRTVQDTLRGRLAKEERIAFPGLSLTPQDLQRFERIAIVGCGTAYHAGAVGKRWLEQWLRRPVEISVASEFRYSDPIVGPDTLVILISQSGETADTLAAMREAKARGATTLAIVNVIGSTLAREADAVILTQAGPEIGVASTKAYLAQLVVLALLGLFLAQLESPGGLPPHLQTLVSALPEMPQLLERCLQQEEAIKALARKLVSSKSFFYLGRGLDYATALEAALKLKEISYLHAEAYPAGEMKHGPLALIEPGVAVIGISTQSLTREKMESNLKEVKARQGTVVVVEPEGVVSDGADERIVLPSAPDYLMPILAIAPLQLLAYYIARERGCDIDQPRNLAKSVTVE
ncbi:glutamine--fructose-6-phosphate transaminase (isomerizing) [Chthonomonas calidirosea]|uniref:Glutamine--fructose-6-phosphate aminotransferase [isomerizing] n=1 Tax=Chthonomonas calidirosea (strain DSM 23976 / ICMP 18418 / T49) TaxID=1303518 RepID=S0EXN4_CHTCT|nr:glutamine--fructose-6-phosphate transaminase (isomerizing) [Chthonomonas calidirosea]CCW36453.1 glutamine--fructose-6-phosphate transaminase [Chthonomonas calidirosea T49]CEK16206.1 glutamine--fructose-6-phosphate transaminase [Chthonomonas calidirosea]CEK17293.1 glutamine--fructose-6-phosphate transaminase [Chthonomonas calidirosea]